jgi:tetratricopeptide (TPR) repeat protein
VSLIRIGFIISLLAVSARAADFQGAAAILKEASGTATGSPTNTPASERDKFLADLKSAPTASSDIPSRDAAKQWLSLADRYFVLASKPIDPTDSETMMQPLQFQAVVATLPPPSAWDALTTAVEARPQGKGATAVRELCLRLLVHMLTNNQKAQRDDLTAFESVLSKNKDASLAQLSYEIPGFAEMLDNASDDPDRLVKGFEKQLDEMSRQAAAQALQSANSGMEGEIYTPTLQVPDLVTLVGKESAENLIRRALVAPVQLSVGVGDDTRALTQRLALEMIDQLKVAQWSLVCTLDTRPLYEALEKKFAAPKESAVSTNRDSSDIAARLRHLSSQAMLQNARDENRRNAQMYYLLGLIADGKSKEAAALLKKLDLTAAAPNQYNPILPTEALDALDRAGHTRQLYDFLHEALTERPELPFWDNYIELAARVGETDEMLTLTRSAADRPNLTPSQRLTIRKHLANALLAADRLDEGVTELRKLLAAPPQSKEAELAAMTQALQSGALTDSTGDVPDDFSKAFAELTRSTTSDATTKIIELGRLLKHDDWVEKGLQALRQRMAASTGKSSGVYDAERLASTLLDLDRGPEAESVLLAALRDAVKRDQVKLATRSEMSFDDYTTESSRILAELAGVYHKAGHHADVLVLLNDAPWWGRKDLAGLLEVTSHREDPLAVVAAAALAATDHKAEARAILDAYLDRSGGHDPAYELLITLGDGNLIPRLDELFRRDQLEERPLIWKAELLRRAGKLDEAEHTARQAIAIDPSDGEEPHGDRMRVYTVLADILEARGDKTQAATYREVVKTIRLSEQADDYYEAGLLKRAVAMYEDALTHFADAYCVQSRTALRLADLGQNDAAEEHYRRAYELMPTSFGRMESHCFGCEHIFDGQRAQSIAEKVFMKLVAEQPTKPQIHYLLGYLREEQGRYPEALASYRQAVALDPDYINAWKHIEELRSHVYLTHADCDAASLNILRLDPQSHHERPNLTEIVDLRALAEALTAAGKLQAPHHDTIYPLAVAKALLDQHEKEHPQSASQMRYLRDQSFYRFYSHEGPPPSPSAMISQTRGIQAITQMIDATVRVDAMSSRE